VHQIVERGYVPGADLPEGTTAGTRRRIAEIVNGAARSAEW
jgi:hypothetical protein